jgi:hypothetical protein
MALSLNSVTPTGHITMIIYWCAGIFNIRGLTFGHEFNNSLLMKDFVNGLLKSPCPNVRPEVVRIFWTVI